MHRPTELTTRSWIAPASAALVAFILSLLFIQTGAWSVFDEYTHFDYVVKVAEDLSLPPVNDQLGQTALQTAVCEKAPGFGRLAAACGADFIDPNLTPYAGASTATSYLPTYYIVTGLGSKVLHALPLGLTWLDAARVMGAFYLGLVALLVVGIARRLGASSLIAFSAAVTVAAMPMVLLQFSTVNNDALAVLLSLAAVYSFLRMKDSSAVRRSLVAFVFAFAAMTVKETALISVLAVVVLSLRDVAMGVPARRWTGTLRVLASAGVVVVAAGILRIVVYPLLVGSLPDNGLQNAAIVEAQGTPPFNLVAGNALRQLSSVFEVPDGVLAGVWFSVAGQVVVLIALGLPLAAILRTTTLREWSSPRRLLGASILIGIPLFVFGFLLLLRVSGLPAFFQPRYLLPLMVLAVAVAAAYIKPAWWRLTVPVATVLVASVGVALMTSPHWSG
jgi:hypothetical protein